MNDTNTLQMITGHGWRMGFANLFHAGWESWWHTKKWLIQTVLWLLFLNGMLAIFLWQAPAETLSVTDTPYDSFTSMEAVQQDQTVVALVVFLTFSAFALPVVAIIAGQEAIIGERQSGTAAWILSKPVSRPAFILSKLAAASLGILVTGVLIQGLVAYIQISLRLGSPLPTVGFSGAMAMLFLNCMFYLTLTYMLGSIFNNRGSVLGISLTVALIGPTILQSLPVFGQFTPWSLFLPVTEGLSAGLAVALGQPLPSLTPIFCTVLLAILFISVALIRFEREEF